MQEKSTFMSPIKLSQNWEIEKANIKTKGGGGGS